MIKQLSVAAALASLAAAQNTPTLAAALNSSSELSTLAKLVPANILQTLDSATNITILAPSNSAFEKIPSQQLSALSANPGMLNAVLEYHVLNGSYESTAITEKGVFVPTLLTNKMYCNVTGGQVVHAKAENDKVIFFSGNLSNSTVTQANVKFTGGVIHVIDNLLTIPGIVSETANAAGLTSVRGALVTADLVETVNTTPDLTVFAPSNDAFQKIGSILPNVSVDDLKKILTYHVVAGTVGYSTRLTNGTSLKTVNGANVTVTVGNDGIFVNNAKVVIADVLVANGVVHVINEVLNPNNATAAKGDDGEPAFQGATPVSDTPFALGNTTGNGTRPSTNSSLPENPNNAGATFMPSRAAIFTALLGAFAAYLL